MTPQPTAATLPPPAATSSNTQALDLMSAAQVLLGQMEDLVPGSGPLARHALVALMTSGHLLLEDSPGTGKTTFAKTFASSIGATASRIQCTPDLMPADITGATIRSPQDGAFSFRPGPVFANIVLADELNRATPRTQSALLEAMAEQTVTIDNVTRKLPDPFFVIATQNEKGSEGTYPLPLSQLDRFAISSTIGYPTEHDGVRMLLSHRISSPQPQKVATPATVLALRAATENVHVERRLAAYVWDIATSTREHPATAGGASPRAALSLLRCACANAVIERRTYVSADDVKTVATAALAHRIRLTAPAVRAGTRPEHVISDVLSKCGIPPK